MNMRMETERERDERVVYLSGAISDNDEFEDERERVYGQRGNRPGPMNHPEGDSSE